MKELEKQLKQALKDAQRQFDLVEELMEAFGDDAIADAGIKLG
jgi:coenzyme F420-reducing hydrogenase alpha subunit